MNRPLRYTKVNRLQIFSSLFYVAACFTLLFLPTNSAIAQICGYGYKKIITIDNNQVSGSGSHTDFPVLISFTDNDLRTTGNGGNVESSLGYDIIFADDQGNKLDHQIEKYVETTGRYAAWVKIPSLSTSVNTVIHMMYGKTGASDPSLNTIWPSHYQGIWHLSDDFLDATGGGNDGTNSGSADQTSSIIGDGQTFGSLDYVETPTSGMSASVGTFSAWAKASSFSTAHQYIFGHTTQPAYNNRIQLYIDDTGGNLDLGLGNSHTRDLNIFTLSTGTWYHVVLTWNGTNYIVYVNGQQRTSGTYTGLSSLQTYADIGNDGNPGARNEEWIGDIDEVRVSNTVIDANWIATEYNNQSNPSSFYSVSSEIELNVSSIGSGDWDQTGIWSSGVVPGIGSNVTILNDVDLDDRDVLICDLTISNSNNTVSRLDIEFGYTLETQQDVNLNGYGTSLVDVNLRTLNGSSKLVVNGDMNLDHDDGDDIIVSMSGGGDSIIVKGDFILQHDGGDDIFIQVSNATSVFRVEGDMTASMNSGTDDIFRMDLNSGEFIVDSTFTGQRSGTFTYFEFDMDGGDFTADSVSLISSGGSGTDVMVIMVDGTSQFTTDDLYMQMAGGDDHRLDVNMNAGTAANLTINDDLIIDKTGADDLFIRVNESSSVFHVGGDFTLTSSGGEELQFQVNNTASVDIDGDMTITHSEGQLNHIYLQGAGANPTFNIDGDFTVNWNGGNDVFSLEMPGGTFSVGGNFTLDKANNTGNVWYNLDDATLTVTDTLKALHNGNGEFLIELDGASTLNAGTFMGVLNGVSAAEELLIDLDDNSQMNVTGNIDLEMNTGNDLEFHLGENSIGSTAQLTVGGNMTLDHNGSMGGDDIQFYLNDNTVADITGIFTMETDGSTGGAGNFYTRVTDDATLSIGGNLVMDNNTGANYLRIELNVNGKLELGGNVVRNASPNNYGLIQSITTTTTIEYNGSIAQVFADEDGAGTDGIEYELVVINNTFGTEPQLTMEAPVTLTNSITFTDGVLQSTAVNLLTIGDNASTNGGNANSYVSGPLQKEGDDAFIFSLGKDGFWARLGISDLQNGPTATDQFTAEYFVARHPESFWDSNSYAGTTGGFYNVSIVEYWDLSRDAGTAEPKVTLYWESGTNSYIDNLTDLRVAHLNGASTWSNEGGTTGGTVAAGSVTTTTNLSSFSPFTFGSLTPASNPLPIELLRFDADASGNVVKLSWETLSEINNDYFTVERSQDGLNFEEVLRQQGAGNSNERLIYYAADDAPYKGVSYYRLKQTDYNGDYNYSASVAVRTGEGTNELILYPNPVLTNSTLYLNKTVSGVLMDARGIKHKDLRNVNEIYTGNLEPGIYLLKTTEKELLQIIVQ